MARGIPYLSLLLAACAGPSLFEDLPASLVQDQLGETCPGVAVGAYGTTLPVEVTGLLTDGELLYAFVEVDDAAELLVLDARDPGEVQQLARVDLPEVAWVSAGAVADGVLLAAWGDRQEDELVSVSVSVPTEPVELDRISLGHGAEPGAIALHQTTAYLDVPGFAALDASSADQLVAVEAPGLPALSTPAIDGDTLVSAGWTGAWDNCWIESFDLRSSPAVALSRIDTVGCATSGLMVRGERVFGIGYAESEPLILTANLDDPGSLAETRLTDRALTGVDEVVDWSGGAVVLASRDSGTGELLAVDTEGRVAGSWSPGLAFVEGAVAAGGVVWATVSFEDGRFAGLAAIDFAGCVP